MKERQKDQYDKDFLSFLKKISFRNRKVLDVGCADGSKTVLLAKLGGIVSACDVLDLRKPEYTSFFDFALVKNEIFPFEDNSFDIVTSFDVIEHVEQDLKFLNEIYRVLRPGGVAYVSTPNLRRMSRSLRTFITGKGAVFPEIIGTDDMQGDCVHLREYTNSTLEYLLKHSNFKNFKVIDFWLGLRIPVLDKIRIRYPRSFFARYAQYLLVKSIK